MIVAIEGIIGAGKSYFINKVKDMFKDEIKIYIEGVDEKIYKEAVKNYYNDRKKYAFPFQVAMLERKAKDSRKAQKEKNKIAVIERIINSNFEVFAKQCYSEGVLEWWQYQWYRSIYDDIKDDVQLPDYILYLNCPTEFAFRRIHDRSRVGENNITLEYLSEIHKLYNRWFEYYHERVLSSELYYQSNMTDEEIREAFSRVIEEVKSHDG